MKRTLLCKNDEIGGEQNYLTFVLKIKLKGMNDNNTEKFSTLRSCSIIFVQHLTVNIVSSQPTVAKLAPLTNNA